jgi:hypothetical protein
MEIEDVKGLAIFMGILAFGAFIMGGIMERRLSKIDELIEDAKYVN